MKCSILRSIAVGSLIPRTSYNRIFTQNDVYYKIYQHEINPYTNYTAKESFNHELDSLCRLETTACADHFPTVIEYDPTRLIIGTRIRRSPTTASIRLQLKTMYDCMRTAGVEHRDIHCKNTMLKNGRCILLDFDAAKTTRYNDTLTSQSFERHKKSHTARNSNDFYNKLHNCYKHETEKTKGGS